MITTFPKSLLIFWMLFVLVATLNGGDLIEKLKVGGFSDPNSESAEANDIIEKNFNGVYSQTVLIMIENSKLKPSSKEFQKKIKQIEDVAKEDQSVVSTESVLPDNNNVINDKDNRAYIRINLNVDDNEALDYVETLQKKFDRKEISTDGFNVYTSGGPGIYHDINIASKESVATVEKIGLPIVFILLLLVFRSVIAAIIPLIMGVFSILISMAILSQIANNISLATLLTNIVTMLGLGISIDYALFITQRFRDELRNHGNKKLAVITAIKTSGRSVCFAGLTVAASLAALLIPNTLLFRSIAIGGFVVVLVSIVVSLTFLPVVLYLLGSKIDLLSIPFISKKNTKIWGSIIHRIMKRPLLYLVIGLILVGAFTPFMKIASIHVPVGAFNQLPSSSQARIGMEAASKDFGVGEMFPISILIKDNKDLITRQETLNEINKVTNELKTLKNVESVRSATNIISDFDSIQQYESFYKQNLDSLQAPLKGTLDSIISKDKNYTIIRVIPAVSPNTEEARKLIGDIREKLKQQSYEHITYSITGETAIGLDYDKKIINDVPMVALSIILTTFVLLIIAFRSILLPIKAILLNALVTVGSLGILIFLFQLGNMPGTMEQALNINTPLLLFAILFGLSIDYEVIIVSRIKEIYDEEGNNEQSIVKGFTSTAGMINGAASIMVVVFGVFIFAQIQIVQELGTGLAFAILMDAIIVRTVIVPTSMKLLGRLNWWIPKKRRDSFNKNIQG